MGTCWRVFNTDKRVALRLGKVGSAMGAFEIYGTVDVEQLAARPLDPADVIDRDWWTAEELIGVRDQIVAWARAAGVSQFSVCTDLGEDEPWMDDYFRPRPDWTITDAS